MADTDDYEILPHKDITELKKEMENLKGGPSTKRLMESMEEMKKTIDDLLVIFRSATTELKNEERDEISLHKKIDRLMEDNKVLAQSLITISEKLDHLSDLSVPVAKEEPKQKAPSFMPQQMPSQPPVRPMAQPPSQVFSGSPSPFSGYTEPFLPKQSFPFDPLNPRPNQMNQSMSPPPFTPRPFMAPSEMGQQDFSAQNQNPYQFTPPPMGREMPLGGPNGPSNDLSDLPPLDDLDDIEPKKKKGLFSAFKK